VRTLTLSASAEEERHHFSGEVKARRESLLAFQVGGKILQRHLDIGARVKAGDPLVTLDASDFSLAVQAADSRLEAARHVFEEARANLMRHTALREKNFISAAELERHRSLEAQARSQLDSAESQARVTRNQLAYTTLKASAEGVITTINAEAGQVVGAGHPVLTLAHEGEREIAIFVPENKRAWLERATSLVITAWAQPGLRLQGQLREIAPVADPLTRTYPARIRILGGSLELGMSASVEAISRSEPSGIRLPLSALISQGADSAVWRYEPSTGRVMRVPVTLGAPFGNEVRVESGLAPGEVVVSAGAHQLHEGQVVRPMASPAP
jgi:RND family efflux transporter MFP subunit